MAIFHLFLVLILAPIIPGIINKTKAFFAGKKGPPLLQLYFDLFKLINKDFVYSKTTGILFRIGPIVNLSCMILALWIVPFASQRAIIPFFGDLILFIALFALARVFMILAAMDTGSSFEGMGASREGQFAILVESAFFLSFASLLFLTKQLSLTNIFFQLTFTNWSHIDPSIILVAISFFLIFLLENSRIPVDDPNTHLELTMIHEVMVLDHSSLDLAYIFYASSLKLWILGTLIINLLVTYPGVHLWVKDLLFLMSMGLFAVLIGVIESIIARLRILKIFDFAMAALAFAIFAIILQFR
ncbi:MAG: NADH-quinone oxidoreductase subunit H [Chlamydiae bacterium]|nr:NADH-quinone oxidoreductase subunit H [Chlamydiota bacterium]